MSLRDYLRLDDYQQRRFEDVYARYRMLYDDPANCSPMFSVYVPQDGRATVEQQLADPLVMLKSCLDGLRPHLEVEDDSVPTVRVEFGTAQVAAAFGCSIVFPENSPAAAGPSVLERAEDVYELEKPPLDAGWYGKLADWTELWLENLPEGVHIQHPDIQSAFNSAHLVRGNDILLDFYDNPEAVEALLDLVTDFMVDITRHVRSMITHDEDWFFDWGALWRGKARISNCSMHMISPEFYRRFVMPRDRRFFDEMGVGRMHYCGTFGEVIREFFEVPNISGLDYDSVHHDLYELCEMAPERVTLLLYAPQYMPIFGRLVSGDWPKKRNLIIQTNASSVDEGKDILDRLRRSVPGGVG